MRPVPCHIGCSIGASKVRVARVSPLGELEGVKELERGQDDSFLTVAALAGRVADFVRDTAAGAFVDLVGVSIKGPGRLQDGKLAIGKWADTPFKDREEVFQTLLEDALRERGVRFGSVVVMLDNEAALRGEMHRLGGLADSPAGMIKIWGTGRGALACEGGAVVRELRANEPGPDRWRVYSSDGRHLICVRVGRGYYRYEYRGVPPGNTRAPINERSGEAFYSERTAGPWLARIVARDLIRLPKGERSRVLQAMGAPGLRLRAYVGAAARDKAVVATEKAILAGLTVAAAGGEDWARARILSIGAEEGTAIAAWAWEFQEHSFVEKIILVSSIGEFLGKDVLDESGGDLLLGALRRSLVGALLRRGAGEGWARKVAEGVARSRLGWERELLPFAP